MSQVPGVTAAHAIITDRCRDVQGGDLEAFDEAVGRARETYQCILPNWARAKGIKLPWCSPSSGRVQGRLLPLFPFQKPDELFRWDRRTEEKPLKLVAAALAKEFCLLAGLHAHGHHSDPEIVRH